MAAADAGGRSPSYRRRYDHPARSKLEPAKPLVTIPILRTPLDASRYRTAAALGLALAACGCLGLALGRGNTMIALSAGVGFGLPLLFVFSSFRFNALLVWVVMSVVAYPFIRWPKLQPIVTFDRMWLGAIAASLVISAPRPEVAAPQTRWLFRTTWWLVLAIGIRAVLTSGHILSTTSTWLDGFLLPALALWVVHREVTSKDRIRKLAGAMMLAGTGLGAIGLFERATGFELATLTGAVPRFDAAVNAVRVSGPYPAPEVFALSLVVCLAATLYWAQIKGRSTYVVAAIAASVQLAAIGFTLFRAAWLSAVIVIVIALGLRPRRAARFIGVSAAVAVALLVTFVQFSDTSTLTERLNNTDNVSGRFATYELAFQIFRTAPFFGVGVDQFAETQKTLPQTSFHGVLSVTSPHSSYMGVLGEDGLWGLLPLLALTFALWRLIHAARRREDPEDVLFGTITGAAALGYLVMSLTLTMLPYGPSNSFFLLLVGAAAARLDASELSVPLEPAAPSQAVA